MPVVIDQERVGVGRDLLRLLEDVLDRLVVGLVTLTQSWVSGISHGLRVATAGTEGALVVTQNETMLSDAPVRGGKTGAAQLDEIPRPATLAPLEDAPTWRVAVVQRLIREFERGIRDGGSPAPNLQDGLRCQAILDAVRESARDGRRVAVPPV